MKVNDVELFEKLKSQVQHLFNEMSSLSKKSPDGPINKFKLKFINEKLRESNSFLVGPHKPFADFEGFDDSNLPTNSDVVLILSQYIDCLEGFRSANTTRDGLIHWKWNTDGSTSIRTDPPTRFKKGEE
jgi:hypothetical protein